MMNTHVLNGIIGFVSAEVVIQTLGTAILHGILSLTVAVSTALIIQVINFYHKKWKNK